MLPVKRGLPHTALLSIFAALQQKFYVAGQDPKEIAFYDDICSALNIEVDVFREAFLSREAMIAVRRSFAQVRDWGVRSFPTLLIEKDGRMGLLANGYVSEDRAIAQLRDMFQPRAMST